MDYQLNLLYENDHPEKSEIPYQYSKKEKASIIWNIFGVYEKSRVNFGVDLIQFGIKNNIPAAVSLGEDISAENQEMLSSELLYLLSQFKLDHAGRMNEGFKTPRVKTSSLTAKEEKYYFGPSSDQPFIPTNYRQIVSASQHWRERWRIPSIFVSDYKSFGVLEKIYDMSKFK